MRDGKTKVKSARRLDELGPSKIRELLDLSHSMEGIINLGIGEPDLDTPGHIREAYVSALKDGHTRYASSMGDLELRQAISDKYKREYNLGYDPESEVLVTNGGVEALYLTISALVNKGDEVIVPDPGYLVYTGDIMVAEARPVGWPVLGGLDPDVLNKLITPKTKLVILNHPSNPTGETIDRKTAKAIAGVIGDNDLILLSDEVYEKIVYDGNHVNMAEFARGRTITINSFSKTYAMTGLRVGYAVGPKDLIGHMAKLHQYTTACVNSATQKAALIALKGPQDCVEEMVKEYKRRRDVMVEGLNKINGISCPKPGGAFYTFPNITGTGLTSEELSTKLLKGAKVATVPGNAFGSLGEGHLRLSYATSCEKIEEAIERIRALLE